MADEGAAAALLAPMPPIPFGACLELGARLACSLLDTLGRSPEKQHIYFLTKSTDKTSIFGPLVCGMIIERKHSTYHKPLELER